MCIFITYNSWLMDTESFRSVGAARTYNKDGSTVEAGRATNRLILSDDSRVNVVAKTNLSSKSSGVIGYFKKIYNELRFVKLERDDRVIYVNVNSLASRVQLSTKEIKHASKKAS